MVKLLLWVRVSALAQGHSPRRLRKSKIIRCKLLRSNKNAAMTQVGHHIFSDQTHA